MRFNSQNKGSGRGEAEWNTYPSGSPIGATAQHAEDIGGTDKKQSATIPVRTIPDARRQPRFKIEIDITITSRRCGLLNGRTVDIIESGIAAMLPVEAPLGEIVELSFMLPCGPVRIHATVRQRNAFRYGFEFVDQELVHEFIRRTCRDLAMYEAKQHGRNSYQSFRKVMNTRLAKRVLLESDFRSALGRKEFLLHYQPKIDLQTGQVTGMETLLRWRHPERGMLLPATFVPIAEECGLILHIGQRVLIEACRQAREWSDSGLGVVPISVNVSAVEFQSKDFLSGVRPR